MLLASKRQARVATNLKKWPVFAFASAVVFIVVFSATLFSFPARPLVSSSFEDLATEYELLTINAQLEKIKNREEKSQAIAAAIEEISTNANHLNQKLLKSEKGGFSEIKNYRNLEIDLMLENLMF